MPAKQHIASSRFTPNGAFTHAFSTRAAGDLRRKALRGPFLASEFKFSSNDLVMAEQVHGAIVAHVAVGHRGKEIAKADALVYKVGAENPIALAVRVADCVPLLFLDSEAGVMGAAHAGWKGTLEGIAAKTVAAMQALGANPKNITVLMGPHIGVCCYNVPKLRAESFRRKFPTHHDVVETRGAQEFLSLGRANRYELIAAGIAPRNIEDLGLCTATHVSDFFSYRADSDATFGEQLGLIAYRGDV
jgi:hypothetical protein